MWVQPDLGSVFRAVVVGRGQLGNGQMSSETSSPLSPSLRLCASPGKGLFLEVREQNPQISMVYWPSISLCSELYSSRAFHAMGSPCTTEDTTGVLVRARPQCWARRMGLRCSVSTQRGQERGERSVMGIFWATRLHVKR